MVQSVSGHSGSADHTVSHNPFRPSAYYGLGGGGHGEDSFVRSSHEHAPDHRNFLQRAWDTVVGIVKDAVAMPFVFLKRFFSGHSDTHGHNVVLNASGFLSENLADESLPASHGDNAFISGRGVLSADLSDERIGAYFQDHGASQAAGGSAHH